VPGSIDFVGGRFTDEDSTGIVGALAGA
jgi:hypothetical protein